MTPHTFATHHGASRPPRRKAPSRESNLLATVAHELRNPLASLRLSLDMLLSDFDELEPESAVHLLRRARHSATYLQSLTENLTSSSAIAAGHLRTDVREIDVRPCIDEAIGLVHGLLEQRHQSARVISAAPFESVLADPARVVQIVANLLANASRYSVDGDEIELSISTAGQQLEVRVTDHGPGISIEDQQRIFGAWIRADGALPGGLGLGLSIVRNLVDRQGGRVGVESTIGEGATFWFTLPMAVARAA
jgi:signal transduction histidine kinase